MDGGENKKKSMHEIKMSQGLAVAQAYHLQRTLLHEAADDLHRPNNP